MQKQSLVCLTAGLLIGTVCGGYLGGMLVNAPLHAVATDRQENFAIATVPVDGSQEAVAVLDFLTGDLKATLFNTVRGPQPIVGMVYSKNVLTDLGVDATKNPKFVMVSGGLQVRPQGQSMFGASVIYVAEVNSGRIGVYALPFNRTQLQNANGTPAEFATVYLGSFRQTGLIRTP
jgi:hypothetical protein